MVSPEGKITTVGEVLSAGGVRATVTDCDKFDRAVRGAPRWGLRDALLAAGFAEAVSASVKTQQARAAKKAPAKKAAPAKAPAKKAAKAPATTSVTAEIESLRAQRDALKERAALLREIAELEALCG
jgi:hypothetical protein